MSKYKKYTQEYRDEAVKMVLENDQPIAKVARDLGMNEGTLGNWVNKYRREHPSARSSLCRIVRGCGNSNARIANSG
ncbi:transposase-like protein [Kineosphaera limosa]|uniref:Putative transposase n=1 Tax=Kineosphaera limosa NBRC 100340 TaxID=1184609 RepID=K6VGN3_9MICO|nr:transposase [Kineosphaera limosa]NYE02067.1 transposase-like protein [Kineosphaera limosa]GAB95328.1 putative transposase [Kineosphaera limosa NBRC 100340]